MEKLFLRIAKSRLALCYFSKYQWYRKFYGGRWELWWIGICASAIWLDMRSDLPDDYRQPCSEGQRMAREDW